MTRPTPPDPPTPGQRATELVARTLSAALSNPARAEAIVQALLDRLALAGLLDRPSATQTAPNPTDTQG